MYACVNEYMKKLTSIGKKNDLLKIPTKAYFITKDWAEWNFCFNGSTQNKCTLQIEKEKYT